MPLGIDIFLRIRSVLTVPYVLFGTAVKENVVVDVPVPLRVVVRAGSFPNDLVLEVVLAENLVEHDFDVVAGVPVAVVIETASFFQNAL